MLKALENLRIAVLCSRRAPALEMLLHHPYRDVLYDVACVLTTDENFAEGQLVANAGVPLIVHPIRRFHRDRNCSHRDLSARREFDAATAGALARCGVNAVVLLGYLYLLTDPMIEPFEGRMINVHDGDLTIRRADGSRKYVGLHATRDAIIAGATETRSSVHFVDHELDGGPLLLLSDAFPVAPFVHDAVAAGAVDIVKAYAYAQREWMIRSSWGGLVIRSLEHLSAGVLDFPNEMVAQ